MAGPVTYVYDAAGNAVADGTFIFTWNTAGRLSNVSTGDETAVSSLYNGHGERMLKMKPQGREIKSTIFVYDPAGRLIGDYSTPTVRKKPGAWQLNQETVWFGDIPVAVLKQDIVNDPVQVYYIHADHLNTPRMIVDSSNTPVWQWHNRNAFGDNLPDEDPDGDSNLFEYNLRFAGQYFDAETNLYYNYFRDYEPQTGRYLSSDPIGLAGGLNTYGYALQNPLSFVDPTGEAVQLPVVLKGVVAACRVAISGITKLISKVTKKNIPKDTLKSPDIDPKDITNKIPAQIDRLAKDKGLIPKGPNRLTLIQ
ncbi:MAG: RHS repeat-associated core domain-containing protein [Nitrosomonas sp.]|nr:RHS repeat-associated core domain-containing protein [Nitrosomonas sp.]